MLDSPPYRHCCAYLALLEEDDKQPQPSTKTAQNGCHNSRVQLYIDRRYIVRMYVCKRVGSEFIVTSLVESLTNAEPPLLLSPLVYVLVIVYVLISTLGSIVE